MTVALFDRNGGPKTPCKWIFGTKLLILPFLERLYPIRWKDSMYYRIVIFYLCLDICKGTCYNTRVGTDSNEEEHAWPSRIEGVKRENETMERLTGIESIPV